MCYGFLTDWILKIKVSRVKFKTQNREFSVGTDFACFQAGTKVLSFTQKSKFFTAVIFASLYDFRHSYKRQKIKKVTTKSNI